MSDAGAAASRIFRTLVNGRQADRAAAQALLGDLSQGECAHLRVLISHALAGEFYAGGDEEKADQAVGWTRCWLLSTLGRLSGGDAETGAIVRKHLDASYEPNQWVRYWTLAGLLEAGVTDIEALARGIIEGDNEPLVHRLALAILAAKGDNSSLKDMLEAFQEGCHKSQWATLRALRLVYIPSTVKHLCEIVEGTDCSDATYQAIMALGHIPSTSPHAERAARTLENFVIRVRRSPWWDGMRSKALRALGMLQVESVGSLLMEELTDDNPDVVREAARAFEKVLGVRTAVTRIVEAASKADPDHIDRYASALRWMNRPFVVEELEAAMVAGPGDQQEGARKLLSEMGGVAAFEKLRTRTLAAQHASTMLEKAEEKIRDLFETSIREARSGYKLSTYMDIVVFSLGIGLVALSAGHVLYQGGSLDSWTGVGLGLTGGTGILGIVYGTLLANPRRQVQEAVDHLMHLKIIFLAYLRQLHQADQAYTRQLLEDKPLTLQDVGDFSKIVQTTMRLAVEQLTMTKSTAPKTRL